jgi:hypothetical protein
MSKGSRARPLSVSQEEFANSFEKIFGKKDKDMQVRANPEGSIGTCGCGRSPTGDCCGWHGLTEDQFKVKRGEWELEQYKKQAQETWNDSCTSGRSE